MRLCINYNKNNKIKDLIKIKKISIDEIKQTFEKYGYTIFRDKIKNSKEKITAIKDGYIYYISLEFLKVNNGTGRLWHKTNPYSIYNMNKWLIDNNIPTQTLESNFEGIKKKMIFICSECGQEFLDSFEHVKMKKHGKCQSCGNKMCHKNKIKTIKNINEKFKDVGLKALEPYTKTHDRIKCQTEDGYFVNSNYYNVKNKTKPIIFHPKNPFTIDNIKHYIEINNLKCELLSNDYVDSKNSYLLFKCECGNVFKTTLSSFIYGEKNRCNICTKRTSKSEYKVMQWLNKNNIKYFEQYRFDYCKNNNIELIRIKYKDIINEKYINILYNKLIN